MTKKILESLDVEGWIPASEKQVSLYLNLSHSNKTDVTQSKKVSSSLVVRIGLIPVDVYCYLKARFGEPNGFQNFLRKDDSDNWIHWEYLVLAGDNYISICGTSREIHFRILEALSDQDWHNLIKNIRKDYARMGKEKTIILNSLEKWFIFPNKYIQISNICADLHSTIINSKDGFEPYKNASSRADKPHQNDQKEAVLNKAQARMNSLHGSCLKLSLLTPVMAEAFINMFILMFCKKAIKENPREFDAFIRSNIDTKIFDMFYKCEGFERKIDPKSKIFKKFKTVMDKRNNAIHGNIDPVKEKTEVVYFDGKRPLFTEAGDHIGKLHEALERLHAPEVVLNDYLNMHTFLLELVNHLHPKMHYGFWQIMEDAYPGYDQKRHITGRVLPDHAVIAMMNDIRYDDELEPVCETTA